MFDYKWQVQECVRKAEAILDRAKAAGHKLSDAERAEVRQLIDQGQDAKDNIAIGEQIDAMRAGNFAASGVKSSGFGTAVLASGFDVKANPSVAVSAGWLVKSTFPAIGDVARTSPALVPMGRDQRWLYPNLERQDVGDALSIQDFKQTARTVTGTVERSPLTTTDKAALDIVLDLVNEPIKEQAVVIAGVPLALFESVDGLREFLNAEGAFQVQKALDAHVFSQIVASAPPFGTTGTGLIAQLRNAVASMRAEGANPTVVVLNPTDAAALDLTTDGAGGYVFSNRDTGSSDPLWGLKPVERTSTAGNEPPYLIDTTMIGKLYIGNLRFDADPYAGAGGRNFVRNLVDLRVEVKALMHVRNARGARRVAAT